MAKAKKQESAATDEKAAKPKAAAAAPAKKEPAAEAKPTAPATAKKPAAAAPKKAGKANQPAAGGGRPLVPLIDTGLAAQTAAAMVAHRVAGGAAPTGAGSTGQESSTFKSLKEGLSKPTAGGLGGILGTGTGQKKFPPQFGGSGKPGGPSTGARNQTFGADVNRAGVPRRTGGG
jgi:hypothetical protein